MHQALQADTTEEHSIMTITIVSAQFPTLCGHPPVTHTNSDSDGDSSDSVFYTRTSSSVNTTSSPLRPSSSLLAPSSPLGPSSSPFWFKHYDHQRPWHLKWQLRLTYEVDDNVKASEVNKVKDQMPKMTRRPLMPTTKSLMTAPRPSDASQ